MLIYSIRNKKDINEIYIGKTNNLKNRIYSHMNQIGKKDNKLYNWLKTLDSKDIYFEIEVDFLTPGEAFYKEKEIILKYRCLGFNVYNQQGNNYHPEPRKKNIKRVSIWEDYLSGMKTYDISKKYGVSISLVSKIISENGGTPFKSKLSDFSDDIKREIMEGYPIRELARKYGVCKNAVSNINKGKAYYDKNLNYPLNKYKV